MCGVFALVVAHPDDEAFSWAGTVASHADDPGFRFVLVHATRGEAGDILSGSYHWRGVPDEQVHLVVDCDAVSERVVEETAQPARRGLTHQGGARSCNGVRLLTPRRAPAGRPRRRLAGRT